MTQQRRLLFANTVSSYLRVLVATVVTFLLLPFIIGQVGDESFGLWSLMFSVLGMVALLDFGLGTAAVKFVAHFKGLGDIDARNRVFSVILIAYIVLAGLAFAAIGALSLFFNEIFSIPADQQSMALALLWILGLRVVLGQLPLNLFRNVLFGEQRIVIVNVITIAGQLLYGALCWWALSSGGTIYSVAIVNLFTMLLEHMAYLVLAYQRVEGLRFTLEGITWEECRELAQFSGYQGVINIASLVLLQMDLMIIKGFMSLKAVAIYAIALRLASHIRILIKQFINVLSPYLAQLKGQGNDAQIRRVLIIGTQLALVPGCILFVCLYYLGFEFVQLWVGPNFRSAYSILMILMAAVMFGLPNKVASNVLGMTGYHRFTAGAAVAAVLMNFFLSVAFLQLWGLKGVAFATVLSVASVDFFAVVGHACHRYGVTWSEYLREACLPALFPGLAQAGFLALVLHGTEINGLGGIFLLGALSAAVYAGVFWTFALDEHLKSLVKGQVLQRIEG